MKNTKEADVARGKYVEVMLYLASRYDPCFEHVMFIERSLQPQSMPRGGVSPRSTRGVGTRTQPKTSFDVGNRNSVWPTR